jgi:hypothetical protein
MNAFWGFTEAHYRGDRKDFGLCQTTMPGNRIDLVWDHRGKVSGLILATVKTWWRRRESNPRPKSISAKRLHA